MARYARLLSFLVPVVLTATLSGGAPMAAGDTAPARFYFGSMTAPSAASPQPIGSYARGCLAGAAALPVDGPHWAVMRLSRNRMWGMPSLVSYIEQFSEDVAKDGWNGLLVGDMSQPRGGPTVSGHASHQIGLDVDIWLTPLPAGGLQGDDRETMGAESLLKKGKLEVDAERWSDLYARMIRRAVSYPEVARIFVSPAIKKQLCDTAGTDRAFLRKLRPWWKHEDHIHVRLQCPPGMAGCADQDEVPPGDGCGADLAWWFKPHPPPKHPPPPAKPLTLANLPAACTPLLSAPPTAPPATATGGGTPLATKRE